MHLKGYVAIWAKYFVFFIDHFADQDKDGKLHCALM
jgi:hypothetical protein